MEASLPPAERRDPLAAILLISAAITAFLVWWIYFKNTGTTEAGWVDYLPAVNATFNTLAAMCLVGGVAAIKRGQKERHRNLMLTAVSFSGLFLVTYLLYHHYHGDTKFPGQGWIRPAYFAILISHIVLSIAMLPMILSTLYHAWGGRFSNHKTIARWTFPVWLYVSVTGVVIFFMLSAYA
ncbi:MAG: DUF420 domain-containing protein [Acidobacteriota bacterium]